VTRAQLFAHLTRLRACEPAVGWATATKGSPAHLWALCPDPRWSLWLAGRAQVDRTLLVLTACEIARTALVHVPAGELRPLRAIETAEAWCRGEATTEQVRAARSAAAAAAAYAAYDAYAAARGKSLAASADIVRKRIPWAVVAAALEAQS